MKLYSDFINKTNQTVYDGFDINRAITLVANFSELDNKSPTILRDKVFLNTTDFSYRMYSSDGTFFTSSRFYVEQNNALDLQNVRLKNVSDGVNGSDGINKAQSENFVTLQFLLATDTKEAAQAQVDIRDTSRGAGYGKDNDVISYFGIANNAVVTPNKDYGLIFFVHEKINEAAGFAMFHESLLGDLIEPETQEIPFVVGAVQSAFGKYNQSATALIGPNARWNCQGLAIKKQDDANTLPPPSGYFNSKSEIVDDIGEAARAVYSFGPFSILDDFRLLRGDVNNIDDQSAEFVANANSEFFVVKARVGGGTFPQKKLFQVFFAEYDDLFYSTSSGAIFLGIEVNGNTGRIELLEDEVFGDDSKVTQLMITTNTNRLVNAVACANRSPGLSAYVF